MEGTPSKIIKKKTEVPNERAMTGLLIISATEHSHVLPDMLSSKYTCTLKKDRSHKESRGKSTQLLVKIYKLSVETENVKI